MASFNYTSIAAHLPLFLRNSQPFLSYICIHSGNSDCSANFVININDKVDKYY